MAAKSISARLSDSFGNSSTTAALIVTVDTTSSTAVATVTALSPDTGSSNSDFVTSAGSQTVSGSYTRTLGSGEVIQVSADGGSTWVTAGTVDTVNHTWSASGGDAVCQRHGAVGSHDRPRRQHHRRHGPQLYAGCGGAGGAIGTRSHCGLGQRRVKQRQHHQHRGGDVCRKRRKPVRR